MKKIFIYALIVICSFSIIVPKETEVKGFLNIRWKESKKEVKGKMLNKEMVKEDLETEKVFNMIGTKGNSTYLCFESGIFGKYSVSSWLFLFHKDQLCKATVTTTKQTNVINEYAEIKETYEKKYGTPKYDRVHFLYPYEYGDGFEETAIRTGKATIHSIWIMDKSAVMIGITDKLELTFAYEYSPLMKIAAEEFNKEQNQDY